MKDKNIVLIGFMGSGKTTISKLLSKKLKREILDIDSLIEKNTAMRIKTIFKKYGEEYFRDLETKTVKSISNVKGKIISTGGGVIVREENIKNLKKNGIIVYLKNSFETSKKRLEGKKNRPLFMPEKINEAYKLYKKRITLRLQK